MEAQPDGRAHREQGKRAASNHRRGGGIRVTEPQPTWTWRAIDRLAAVSWRFIACAVALAIVVVTLSVIRSVVVSVVFALLFSAVLMPLSQWLQRHHVKRALAAILSVLLLAIVLLGVGALLLLTVVQSWGGMSSSVAAGADNIAHRFQESPFSLSAAQTGEVRHDAGTGWSALLQVAEGGVARFVSLGLEAISLLFFSFVLTLYFLVDEGRLWRALIDKLPAGQHDALERLGGRSWSTLRRYMQGTLLVGLCDGAGIGLGMWILQIPYALPIAVLMVFAEFVPIFGATIVSIVAVLIGYADGGLPKALGALLIIVPVQQFNAHFTSPLVVGHSVEIHPLAILLGIPIGTALAGFPGAVIIVPLFAILAIALGELRSGSIAAVAREPHAETAATAAPVANR
jgi:predicted PurR-regulated permease PerM